VKINWNIGLPIIVMLIFSVTRWPGLMPGNFSAAYAIAFCAGVYFPGRLAWWLPLTTLLVTDIIVNVLYYQTAAISPYMGINYACFAALIWLGRRFRSSDPAWKLIGGGLAGAVLFYLVTNTFSWMQNPAYPKSVLGWIQALTTGLPGYPPTWTFFRSTLLSGGLFTGLFVGAMKLSEAADTAEETEAREEPQTEEA
jgi:hypothetical protein